MVRQLAVIETPAVFSNEVLQQLVLLSDEELVLMQQKHPELTVRWAEQEDRKQWALSQSLFSDPRGILTREMLILPDEVVGRFRAAKKNRRR